MHPEIGPWHINSYWVVTFLSFIPVLFYTYYVATRIEHLPPKMVILFIFQLFLVQLFGGGLLPYFYEWYRIGIYLGPYQFWMTGRYFHGVLFVCLLFYIFYVWFVFKPRLINFSFLRCLDYFVVGVCMMSAVGRIGCFLQGCCSGKPTQCFLGVQFPNMPVPVHPTQLYHFFFEACLLLPFLLRLQKTKKFEGETTWAFFCVYSVFRFFVEFLRTNPIAWLGLTHAQLASLVLTAISGVCWIRGWKRAASSIR